MHFGLRHKTNQSLNIGNECNIMPIYQVGEHEILQEPSSLIKSEDEFIEGTLFLSDKRLVFEKTGKRGFFRATPGTTLYDIGLYEISNVYVAIPKLRIFTKKTLTVEYSNKNSSGSLRFTLMDPELWESNIRKFASDLKKIYEEQERREREDEHRKNVEMARAKAGTTNVGVMNIDSNRDKRKEKDTVIDADDLSQNYPQKAQPSDVEEYNETCPECGSYVPDGAKYCPSCGYKLRK